MLKEFNLNNYQYVEDHLSFSNWLSSHRPQKNHLDPEARLNGFLYEHEGDQWDHIVQLPTETFWTVYEENNQIKIRNGYQVRGRIGYVITSVPHNAHRTIIVDDLTKEMLEHRPSTVYSWYSTELLGESRENIKDLREKFNPENFFTFSEWLQKYKPQPNELDSNARLSGLLYEHAHEQQANHVNSLDKSSFWTVYEEQGQIEVRNGVYGVPGRLGYVVCAVPHDSQQTLLVKNITPQMLDHRLGSDH